jgi:hypothetical protein
MLRIATDYDEMAEIAERIEASGAAVKTVRRPHGASPATCFRAKQAARRVRIARRNTAAPGAPARTARFDPKRTIRLRKTVPNALSGARISARISTSI